MKWVFRIVLGIAALIAAIFVSAMLMEHQSDQSLTVWRDFMKLR